MMCLIVLVLMTMEFIISVVMIRLLMYGFVGWCSLRTMNAMTTTDFGLLIRQRICTL